METKDFKLLFSSNTGITLKGKNIILVPFSEKHLHHPNYLNGLRDYEVIKYINRPEYLTPISFGEVELYVSKTLKSENDFFFAIETINEGKFIGTFRIGYTDWYHKSVNLGILIGDKHFWGKGIASEAFSLVIKFCFEKLGMHKIIGGCMAQNIGMRKIFEKLGFKEEGCFREQDWFEDEYHDHYHYGLLKSEYENKCDYNV